jgi:hypothetical protein
MASLRKRAADPAVAIPDPPTEAQPETVSAPPDVAPHDDASEALQRQIDALRQSESMQQQAAIGQLAANERRHAWLASTPGARENVAALGAIHHAALSAGLADTSPEYFSFMESQLAGLQRPTMAATHMAEEMQQRAERSRTPEPPPRPSRVAYSAPVSRDIPDGTGRRDSDRKVTLTREEQEMARVSGVSLEEYARQKLKLSQMRAIGEYGEDRR